MKKEERIQINVRFTKEERDKLEQLAAASHMNVTTYIKYVLFVKGVKE